jgi:hypothetical protein
VPELPPQAEETANHILHIQYIPLERRVSELSGLVSSGRESWRPIPAMVYTTTRMMV